MPDRLFAGAFFSYAQKRYDKKAFYLFAVKSTINSLVINCRKGVFIARTQITLVFCPSNLLLQSNRISERQHNRSYVFLQNNDVVSSKQALCYDCASLFAAVLRSNNIPTKLIMGYRSDMELYHAWNEVLLDGKWVIIDTTADSPIVQSGRNITMEKHAVLYPQDR